MRFAYRIILQFAFLLGCVVVKCSTTSEDDSIAPAPRVTAISTNLTEPDGTRIWMWPISEDERRRLTAMLGQDFRDLNIGGTFVNNQVLQCPKCNKDNEFIDWVYTALEKGFHTPEFIYESLRNRKFPKESKHDVFCSRCGALTDLRRRPGTPPEVPKVNKKLLRLEKEKALLVAQNEVEKDVTAL